MGDVPADSFPRGTGSSAGAMRRSFLLLLSSTLALLALASGSAADRSPTQVFPESWSPDGRYITLDSGFEIHPDGTGQRRIPGGGFGYAWSSDGRFLAFSAKGNDVLGTGGGIFVETANGGHRRELTRQ